MCIRDREYLGDSVSINHIEIGEVETGETYIPTEADLLALASNEVLEIAAGDTVTATYTDERTESISNGSRLLTRDLMATYNNAEISPIAYDYNVAVKGIGSPSLTYTSRWILSCAALTSRS